MARLGSAVNDRQGFENRRLRDNAQLRLGHFGESPQNVSERFVAALVLKKFRVPEMLKEVGETSRQGRRYVAVVSKRMQ